MFEEYTIYTDSFEHIYQENHITGFRFRIRLAMDRGIWLSTIGGFYIAIDDMPAIPQENILLTIEGDDTYPVEKLEGLTDKRWNSERAAWLTIAFPGGLTGGTHTIAFQEILLTGYYKAKEEWVTDLPHPGAIGKITRFSFQIDAGDTELQHHKNPICVSLDCYKQSRYLCGLTLFEVLYEVSRIKGVTGIDASAEALLAEYPKVSDEFIKTWTQLLDFYQLKAITLSSTTDRLQYRSHVMDVEETAEALKRDIQIAKKLGFRNLRIMHDIPIEAIEIALPLAKQLDIRLLDELMPPATIKPRDGRKGMDCYNGLQLIKRTGTKHFGFQVNTGLFQTRPNPTQLLDELIPNFGKENAEVHYEKILHQFYNMEFWVFEIWIQQNYPYLTRNRELFQRMFGQRLFGHSVHPEDLQEIIPYIYDVYVKYMKMYPMSDKEAVLWYEPSVPHEEVFQILLDNGYKEAFTSLRMNAPGVALGVQRTGAEIFEEEKAEIHRNQEMIQRLLNRYE